MKNKNYYSVISKIELIEKNNIMIEKLKSMGETPIEITLWQFQKKKEKLIKELLVEMINSGISFSQCENTYQNIFSYLKKNEKETTLPQDLEKDMSQLNRLLVIS